MLTGKIRNQVDEIWNSFWTGGVSNPISVIEQFSYLLFIRRLDQIHTNKERVATLGHAIENPVFGPDQQDYRWNKLKNKDPQVMFELMSNQVFPFIKNLKGEDSSFAQHMRDAIFMIPSAALLDRVVNMIDKIDMNDRDTKGDLYEYMLSKLQTSGTNGQFRTPRHIIRMMVEMTQPILDGDKSDVICDPASGTCGFLMSAEEYIRDHFAKALMRPENAAHFHKAMFNAYDFDPHMLRIGAMNLMLHGVEHPTVEYRDSLMDYGEGNIKEKYSLILANPPFKGSVAYDELSPDLLTALGKTPKKDKPKPKLEYDENGELIDDGKPKKKGPSEKTELLFLALILRLLQPGGRAAVIVPDGVLFGSTKSHKAIRKTLIEEHKLQGVVSMPSGVFKPYAGVSTAILLFTKTNSGGTKDVWFYDMQADGFSLDDKRNPLFKAGETPTHEQSNIADVIERWKNLNKEKKRKRTDQSFMVSKADIVKEGYDLSINRYKEVVYEEVKYDPPKTILKRIKKLQQEMEKGIVELEGML
ncbi:type I restriction-modification system subunit M [Aliikangiella sp. IMCC44359]|uniref:type I restriction-modification system subunit M n=1 Tax=Aliikangiella sp. IMCC44359 TaxID=3459125 RepID=UPI00403AEA84